MASYTVKLTPDVVNLGTEGSLDVLVGGVSIQRTMDMVLISNGGFKMVSRLKDGAEFTDTVQTVADYANVVTV